MKKFLGVIYLFSVVCLFFYPVFRGYVPFPGDLTVGEYTPYKTYQFYGFAPGSYPNKGQDFDVLELLYPGKEFSINQIRAGNIPLWNPFVFSGHPQLAALQAGALYPLNIIFLFFPFAFAWSLFIFIEPLLAAVFTYLFLRKLRLGELPSLLGSIAFAFSSYMLVWVEYGNMDHVALWLPLVLLLVMQFLERPKYRTGIYLSTVLSLSLLAGYIQTTFFLSLFAYIFGIFIYFQQKTKNRNLLLMLALPFIFSALLCAVQILPTLELVLRSARSAYTYQQFINLLIPNFHISTLFAPDFFGNPATRNYWLPGTYIERAVYIGVVPLFFVFFALFSKRNRWVYFFSISALSVLLLTFDTPITRQLYRIQIPFFSTAVPTRILFLFSFSACTVAAFGFENFIKEKDKRKFIITASVMGIVYLLLWAIVFAVPHFVRAPWVAHLTISKHNLILPTLFMAITLFAGGSSVFIKRRKYIYPVFILLTIADLFYSFQKLTPFAPLASVYPDTPVISELRHIQGINRSWGYANAYIQPNLPTHEKIYSTDGYDALHDKRYGQLISTGKNGRIADPLPRSDVNLAGGYGTSDLTLNTYRKRLLDLLGVKYVLNVVDQKLPDNTADTLTFPQKQYTLIWQKNPWQIYENKNALPRFFLASDYVIAHDHEIIQKIYDPNTDLKNTLILEKHIPGYVFSSDSEKRATLLSYAPNSISIRTSSSKDQLLFLSDVYYPGWEAAVDGRPAEIYRADYAFRAVPLTKGTHVVEFTFDPQSFEVGKDVTFAAIISIFLISGLLIYKSRYVKDK